MSRVLSAHGNHSLLWNVLDFIILPAERRKVSLSWTESEGRRKKMGEKGQRSRKGKRQRKERKKKREQGDEEEGESWRRERFSSEKNMGSYF